MQRWWDDYDVEAQALLVRVCALRSDTRPLNDIVGGYGEYVAWKALGGSRLPQATGREDIQPLRGRIIEVKSTASPRSWRLQYSPWSNEYALVRFDPVDC
jgi:hypothetical protein